MFCSILELNYKGGQKPMKKLETITTTEYKVTEVVCNGCGKPIPQDKYGHRADCLS